MHKSVLLCHVFPVATGHVTELFLGIHAFFDTDSLKIGAPKVLENLIILAEHLGIQFAIGQVEGYSGLMLESDTDGAAEPS